MKLKNILAKVSGLLLVTLSIVSLPVLIYSIAEWGYSLEDGLGLLTFVVAPATVGGILLRVGNKNLKVDLQEKQEHIALQLAQKSGGSLTALELATKTNMKVAVAEACLNRIHLAGLAQILHAQNGAILYEFPDLLNSKEKGESERLI